MHILAITQARIGSTRFPEKILQTINGESLLEIHLKRILKSRKISKLKVATTTEPGVEKIIAIANRLKVETFQGSLENVLNRFYNAAKGEVVDWIVRLTSDCPLIDPVEIDKVIDHALAHNLDYVSNTLRPTFPDGLDVEVFKFSALENAHKNATLQSEKEHVTPFIWKHSSFMNGKLFSSDCVFNDVDLSHIRLTIDTLEDYKVITALVDLIGTEESWQKYVAALQNNPKISDLNAHQSRNEGYQTSIAKESGSING